MKLIAISITLLLVFGANAGGYNRPNQEGRCRNAGARYPDGDLESCAGIQTQHEGGFPPFEEIVDGIMDGLAPQLARMLDEKGYLRQAKCPYGHMDHIDNPFFSTIINSQIVGGVSRQFLGVNLATGSSNIDTSGDWGNTTVRQRFLCPSAGTHKSPVHTFVCDNRNNDCPMNSDTWSGVTLLEAAGFENSAECAEEFTEGSFTPVPITVASNTELLAEVEAQPGTVGLLPLPTAEAGQTANPNLVILQDRIKCAAAYGFVTRKDDEDLCHCLTRAINLVDPYDYAETCCSFRSPKYDDTDIDAQAAFDLCIDDSSAVNDEGTIELPSGFTFSDCANYFCHRPGDSGCY